VSKSYRDYLTEQLLPGSASDTSIHDYYVFLETNPSRVTHTILGQFVTIYSGLKISHLSFYIKRRFVACVLIFICLKGITTRHG